MAWTGVWYPEDTMNDRNRRSLTQSLGMDGADPRSRLALVVVVVEATDWLSATSSRVLTPLMQAPHATAEASRRRTGSWRDILALTIPPARAGTIG
jgi:hypothetical protein